MMILVSEFKTVCVYVARCVHVRRVFTGIIKRNMSEAQSHRSDYTITVLE